MKITEKTMTAFSQKKAIKANARIAMKESLFFSMALCCVRPADTGRNNVGKDSDKLK